MRSARLAVAAIAIILAGGTIRPAYAQQTLNFTLGSFVPRGQDARAPGDVLLENSSFLTFEVEDFSRVTGGAEWLVPLGSFVEAGAGVSFYRRTVPTVYRDFTDSTGREIEQNLRLRMIPLAFTLRVVPTGLSSPIQPYFGAGVALVNWRYSEFGDFIDFGAPGRPVRPGTFVATGTSAGPVAFGGLRFGSEGVSVGGEIRYQRAEGELDGRFAAPTLDLGGWTYQLTLGLRFGR